jgi:dTDP-4-amino-4,6-dideoxygalactose transaminase
MSFFPRRIPPVHSPLSLRASWAGALQAARVSRDSRSTLRDKLAREYDADQLILCGSGTQALHLSLQAAGQRLGGSATVALPAFTCFDVATAAVAYGESVALYDIDPDTLAPDFDSLRGVLDDGARIVVISPLYGIPVDWDAVEKITSSYSAIAIEDAAQGHGAAWRSKPLGSLGELSVLSFGRGKGWTGVRGGALLLREEVAAAPEAPTSTGGLSSEVRVILGGVAQWTLARPSLYNLPASLPFLGLGETVYHEPTPIAALPRSSAAILSRTWPDAWDEAARRREKAEAMLSELTGPAVRPIQVAEDASPGYLRLPLRLQEGMAGFHAPGDAARLGIAPAYPTTLAALPQLGARLRGASGGWPGAEELARTLITVPTHSLASEVEVEKVLHLLNSYSS